MKVTFFRILSILILTISGFTTSAHAQYSVCCPASDANCQLPENQCNDYLEATAEQPSVQNWLDRVSNAVQNSNSNHADVTPVKTAPEAATPLDFDIISRGPCGGFSANAAEAKKAAEQIDQIDKPRTSKLLILREDCPVQTAAPQIDAAFNLLIERSTKRPSTWSLVSHLKKQPAKSISYWDAVKNIDYSANISREAFDEEVSYWDAVKDIDYSANISREGIGEGVSYWDAVKSIDYSANISQRVSNNVLKADNPIAKNPEPNYSQYDLYDVEASYLYGCFGNESSYGKGSSESVAEVTVPQQAPIASEASEITGTETTESSSEMEQPAVPFGAELDGYLPYDINDEATDRDDPFAAASIGLMQKRSETIEAIEQNSKSEISCPFEYDSLKPVAECPFTLNEIILLPRLLLTYANQILAAWQQANFVDNVWLINSRIETTLCGSESLTVWRDAIWAHQKSLEVARELELAQLRREKILSIAQTLDLLANQLKAASANLINLAERESHKLIGRRTSASLNR